MISSIIRQTLNGRRQDDGISTLKLSTSSLQSEKKKLNDLEERKRYLEHDRALRGFLPTRTNDIRAVRVDKRWDGEELTPHYHREDLITEIIPSENHEEDVDQKEEPRLSLVWHAAGEHFP